VAKTFYDRKMFYNIGPLVSVLQKKLFVADEEAKKLE
jgi:hypothetical protein